MQTFQFGGRHLKFHQLFFASLYEPKKLAAFRLLPIGKVIQYIFILIFFYTAVSFLHFFIGDSSIFDATPELVEIGETIGPLLYPIAFILQLVIITFYIFIRISLFALIGVGLLKLMKRRGEFRFMWRTASIAATLPILLTMTIDFLPALQSAGMWMSSAVHFIYVALAASYYPKQPR